MTFIDMTRYYDEHLTSDLRCNASGKRFCNHWTMHGINLDAEYLAFDEHSGCGVGRQNMLMCVMFYHIPPKKPGPAFCRSAPFECDVSFLVL